MSNVEEILQAFLARKETLDEVERTGIVKDESYEIEFMRLRDQSAQYKIDGTFTSVEGETTCNIVKNRYKDIVPYDHTRVTVDSPSSSSDYINASFIKGALINQNFIAAQGPLPGTVNDFWIMIWQYNVKVILMACNEVEGGKLRCKRYWPQDENEKLTFGDITVSLKSTDPTPYSEYHIRHMTAMRGDEQRDVTHLHYTAWPDRGVPRCIPSIWDMIEKMREFQPLSLSNDNQSSPDSLPRIVVHCSAGCGRTGTILVLDYVLALLKFGKVTKDFSLFDIITEMRRQRMAIVQSLEQYVFVHEAVANLFDRQLVLINQHLYENLDTASNRDKTPRSTESKHIEDLIDISDAPRTQSLPTSSSSSSSPSSRGVPAAPAPISPTPAARRTSSIKRNTGGVGNGVETPRDATHGSTLQIPSQHRSVSVSNDGLDLPHVTSVTGNRRSATMRASKAPSMANEYSDPLQPIIKGHEGGSKDASSEYSEPFGSTSVNTKVVVMGNNRTNKKPSETSTRSVPKFGDNHTYEELNFVGDGDSTSRKGGASSRTAGKDVDIGMGLNCNGKGGGGVGGGGENKPKVGSTGVGQSNSMQSDDPYAYADRYAVSADKWSLQKYARDHGRSAQDDPDDPWYSYAHPSGYQVAETKKSKAGGVKIKDGAAKGVTPVETAIENLAYSSVEITAQTSGVHNNNNNISSSSRDVRCNPNDDDDVNRPTIPERNYRLTQEDSISQNSMPSGNSESVVERVRATAERMKDQFFSKKPLARPAENYSHPAEVFYKDHQINYPHRVGKPKGKRPTQMKSSQCP